MNNKKVNLKKIKTEFKKGYEVASCAMPSITFLGSARLDKKDKNVKASTKLAKKLVKYGYSVITGGGEGIMRGANKGAYKIDKNRSYGFNISLPHEQHINKYVYKSFTFTHFYSRKYMLFNFSEAVIVLAGGYGTLDELFELLVLIQTKKLDRIKIYLYGKSFGSRCLNF